MLDNSMMVRELRGGANYATYLNGPRGPEYRRDDVSGQVRWYVYDGLGSVVGELDPSGNLTAARAHDVYGCVRSTNGTRTTAHGFVGSLGHTSEDNTGLIYMRARYMDPVLGRFVSEDPGLHGTNWYVYGSNNPTNRLDPTGKEDVNTVYQWLVIIIGGGCAAAFAWMLVRPLAKGFLKLLGQQLVNLGNNMIEKGEEDVAEAAEIIRTAAGGGPLEAAISSAGADLGMCGAREIAMGVALKALGEYLIGAQALEGG